MPFMFVGVAFGCANAFEVATAIAAVRAADAKKAPHQV